MLKRFGMVLLWLSGLLLVLVSGNLHEPYLVTMRGLGALFLLAGSIAGVALLLSHGFWTRHGAAGKLLVALWCLTLPAMLSSEAIFQWRKFTVLRADDEPARKLGRHFIVGYTSFDEIALLAAKGLIGGIYVSTHNISGRTAAELTDELSRLQNIRRTAGLPPLIVAADQEGGIVSHLSPQLTALPALSTLAGLPSERRSKMAEQFGRLHGRELAAVGVTLNFAPVVDLLRSGPRNRFDFNSLISLRAISNDPSIAADVALSYVHGLETAGVEGTVKHFPGLGRVREDTHHFSIRRRPNCKTPTGFRFARSWRTRTLI
jgi:beta-N-acetylhexosaminidase